VASFAGFRLASPNMIVCPDCGKNIADDSAHCGFCGAEIESGGGKKTMIGFAAVTGDVMKQAAEEARKAREASGGLGDQPSEGKLKIPKPNIPMSSSGESAAGGLPAPGKLSLPKLGAAATSDRPPPEPFATAEAKTEALTAVSPAPVEPEAPAVPAEQPTAGGAPSTIEEHATPSADVSDEVATAPTEPPRRTAESSWSGPSTGAPASADPAWAAGNVAETTMPEITSPGASDAGPMVIAGNTLPEKKTNKLLIPVIALAVLVGGCCILAFVGSWLI